MKKSIVQDDRTSCFICGRNGSSDPLEKHHIFFGNPNREKSEEDGLFVYICGNCCHRNGKEAVHRNKETNRKLREIGQRAWEREYGSREGFIKRYGINYLTKTEEEAHE